MAVANKTGAKTRRGLCVCPAWRLKSRLGREVARVPLKRSVYARAGSFDRLHFYFELPKLL
jgi:hypothetical protein